jgi:ribonuclease HI
MTFNLSETERKKLQQIIDARMSKKQIVDILTNIVNGLREEEKEENNDENNENNKEKKSDKSSNSKTNISKTNKMYVDGGCNKMTGDEAWGSVVDDNKNCLITKYKKMIREEFPDLILKKKELPVGVRYIVVSKFNDVASQQNNGAELLAMMIGLYICSLDKNYNIVYSDSDTVIKWWSKNHISKEKQKTMDKEKMKYIKTCSEFREKFEENGGKIEKIDGGRNKADLGFHK